MFAYCNNDPVANEDPNGHYIGHQPIMVNDGYNTYIPPIDSASPEHENNTPNNNEDAVHPNNNQLSNCGTVFCVGAVANTLSNLVGRLGRYSELSKLTRGTGLQIHHLLEQRFFKSILQGGFYTKKSDMLCVIIDKDTHQGFTNAWREAIPYGADYSSIPFETVQYFAIDIYGSSHPDWISALFD